MALSGRDPLAWPEFPRHFSMLGDEREEAHIFGSARMLVSARLRAQLRQTHCEWHLRVPFMGLTEETYDAAAGSPGALRDCLLGMSRWAKDGGYVCPGLYVTRQDARHLPNFVRGAMGLGARGFHFVFHEGPGFFWRSSREDVPRWREVKGYVEAAARAAQDQKFELWYSGLPECMLAGLPWGVVDAWRPFDERLTEDGRVENLAAARAARQRKARSCAGCLLSDTCDGAWKFYLDRYGDGELSPVREFADSRGPAAELGRRPKGESRAVLGLAAGRPAP